MSSSAASPSAGSAASPPSLTPAPPLASKPSLCMKPLPTAISPAASGALSPATLTSKEWIVPPRPKPGRKPATDTPPTKRKAQNRAAQRAFRERRAARVGELEEQIKLIEDEHDQQQDDLRLTITQLEEEVERYRNDLTTWIDRCRQLEKELAEARSSATQTSTPVPTAPQTTSSGEVVGCGNCTLETRCQCIDDAFNAMTGEAGDGEQAHQGKRATLLNTEMEHDSIKAEPSDSMEIDFTAMYSKSNNSTTRNHAVSPSSAMADPCGFCQDGTPCICAEMAAEQERTSARRPGSPAVGHRQGVRQMAQFTPPPSEGDVTNPTSVSSGCASGPGTCAQCQSDPNSTLFCKSLAASRSQSRAMEGGCCGGKGADGGCCQTRPMSRSTRSRASANARHLPPPEAPKASITLTCADAYTTLSRHPAYEKATGEIASWMPKLYANASGSEGRPAMEIDAANVMAVLRDFDRRFGTDR